MSFLRFFSVKVPTKLLLWAPIYNSDRKRECLTSKFCNWLIALQQNKQQGSSPIRESFRSERLRFSSVILSCRIQTYNLSENEQKSLQAVASCKTNRKRLNAAAKNFTDKYCLFCRKTDSRSISNFASRKVVFLIENINPMPCFGD